MCRTNSLLDRLEIRTDRLEDLARSAAADDFWAVSLKGCRRLQFGPQYWFCARSVNALSRLMGNTWTEERVEITGQLRAEVLLIGSTGTPSGNDRPTNAGSLRLPWCGSCEIRRVSPARPIRGTESRDPRTGCARNVTMPETR